MKRTLLIEDDHIIADLVTTLLAEEGYDVDWVRTVDDGLQYLETSIPALILLDLTRPDGHGAVIVRHCKSDPNLAALPIITMSGASQATGRRADGSTDDHTIQKPFNIDNLTTMVNCLIGGARTQVGGDHV